MPRRRPGALRAQNLALRDLWRPDGPYATTARRRAFRMDGLSGPVVAAVLRAEASRPPDEGLGPGDTAAALRCIRRFLARPGRYLYPEKTVCGCTECERGSNPAAARDVLTLTLSRLPRHARREFAVLVAGLDEELRRRTLPDPFAHRQPWHRPGPWWHTRIYHESHHM